MSDFQHLTGIDHLRCIVALCNNMSENFNDRFTAAQLMTLWYAFRHCEWDLPPDEWADRQVLEALCGVVPTFDDEQPTYGPVKTRTTFDINTGVITSPKRAPKVAFSSKAEREKGAK